MRVVFRQLGSAGLTTELADLSNDLTVAELKRRLGQGEVKLVYLGKTLNDKATLAECKIKDGAKVHVVISGSKGSNNNSSSPVSKTATASPSGPASRSVNGESEICAAIRNQLKLPSDAEAERVAKLFLKKFEARLNTLSLDDIERVCHLWHTNQPLKF